MGFDNPIAEARHYRMCAEERDYDSRARAADAIRIAEREAARKVAAKKLTQDLTVICDHVINSHTVNKSQINLVAQNLTKWEGILTNKLFDTPQYILKDIFINSYLLAAELKQSIIKLSPLLKFLVYPCSETFAPYNFDKFIFFAKKASICLNGKQKEYGLLIEALTKVNGTFTGQWTNKNIENLQHIINKYNNDELGPKTRLSQDISKKLSTFIGLYRPPAPIDEHLSNSQENAHPVAANDLLMVQSTSPISTESYADIKQKYDQELDGFITTASPKNWIPLVRSYFNLATTNNDFLLYCINTRQAIQVHPIQSPEELQLILNQIDQGDLQKFDTRINAAIYLTGIDARKLSYSYRIIYEAIASVIHAMIFKNTFADKEQGFKSLYPDDAEKDGNVITEINQWRELIKTVVYKEIGKLIKASLMLPHPYLGHDGKLLKTSSLDQCFEFLQSLLQQNNVGFVLKEKVFSAFRVIDHRTDATFSSFSLNNTNLSKAHSFLIAHPTWLYFYYEYAASAVDRVSTQVRQGFFSQSVCCHLRFSNINLVKQDLTFLLNNLSRLNDFHIEENRLIHFQMYSDMLFNTIKKIDESVASDGAFMLEQFKNLLNAPQSNRIHLSLLSSMRRWLDSRAIPRPVYDHYIDYSKRCINVINMGYPEAPVSASEHLSLNDLRV